MYEKKDECQDRARAAGPAAPAESQEGEESLRCTLTAHAVQLKHL